MSDGGSRREGRRRFLYYLAASPLFAATGISTSSLARLLHARAVEGARDGAVAFGADGVLRELEQAQQGTVIQSPDQALSVLDFEPVARMKLPPAHFGYVASSVDDDAMLRVNREGFTHFQLKPRRLVDVTNVDASVQLLGEKWPTPIFICPAASHKALHPDGELGVARAAKAREHLQMLSGVATTSVEEVNAARGKPVWYQLYPTDVVDVGLAVARRAQRAGCPVLILTVDLNAGRNLETQLRMARFDTRTCSDCHGVSIAAYVRRKPMFDGLDVSKATAMEYPGMTWDYVRRMRDNVPGMKLFLKGITTREDAATAVRSGVDGIVVSNHGGRAEDSGRSTIDCLPDVLAAVGGRVPVLIDSGFRRGTDVIKAMALGAASTGIGRPYLWGLAAFGQPGVEMVLMILQRETELALRQMGATTLAKLSPGQVIPPARAAASPGR